MSTKDLKTEQPCTLHSVVVSNSKEHVCDECLKCWNYLHEMYNCQGQDKPCHEFNDYNPYNN